MVEFACATPLMVILLGGAHDLGLAQYSRISLATAVAGGAEYAYLVGSGYAPTDTTSINGLAVLAGTVVIRGTPQVSSTQTITTSTANGVTTLTAGIMTVTVTGPRWACLTVTGNTVTLPAGTGTCLDGSPAGLYISIDATYSNTGLMAGFISPSSYVVGESARVLLQ